MNYSIIIPAYNEEAFIGRTLQSLVEQTRQAEQIVVVDDNSTDQTATVVSTYQSQYPHIKLVYKQSDNIHLPGSKVIQAFQTGFNQLDASYDVIVKLDADLILPTDYFEQVMTTFEDNPKVGMVGGFAYIEKNGKWILENLTDPDHIRGAFKAYRKSLFVQMGGLKPAMGWDTVDELLCRFYQWEIVTLPELKVKHLKPTGALYNKTARYKQGEAFYSLQYGIAITLIAALKLAIKKKRPLLFFDYIQGYYQAKKQGISFLVTDEQGRYIRNYRWKKIKSKLI
ncbi:glycosyltransferase family 2 protein [Flavobacterium sp. NKUCC04_CG]|uniref:glycosyltransferase n=1 Tax=Flavobacterium sp. NKUCC04_CG TaxID=2842121 RepID=UPI001C5AAD71|nr:glycosyltransferase family A protein [Flavobacterium sp. NKUCC04_CG]MBW3517680.1 glycosyltransferase family 2 protein [Flavobacterium sp. NKUCC04_CG]